MKDKDIPQDNDKNYEGHSKLRYGRSECGTFVAVPSSGCAIEQEATACAWEDIKESLKITIQKVKGGELSPLAYHMEKALLTPDLLAPNVNQWTWQVRRHLNPKTFAKLPPEKLQTYAEYFDLTVDALKKLPEDE